MTAPAVLAALFPRASAERPTPRCMMEQRHRPFWHAVIRVARDADALIGWLSLATAGSLFGMMAIRILAAWQAGRL